MAFISKHSFDLFTCKGCKNKGLTANGDFDNDKAFNDSRKISRKEFKRRLNSGYYNTGKKK